MNKVFTNLAFIILRIISYLPSWLIRILGSALGWVGYTFIKRRRNIGLKNLSLCFPNMSEAEKNRIIKEHFKQLMTSALEYGLVFYASRKTIHDKVQIKNIHLLLDYYKKRPVILLCPHMVSLDLGALRLSQVVTGYSIYSKQKNDIVGERLKKARTRFIPDTGEIFSRQEGLRPVIKRLRETNNVFYYLPDQDLGERDSIYVPFFAYPTCATVNVLPKLAKLTNAVVISMVVCRVGSKVEVELFEVWQDFPSGNLEADVCRMNHAVERAVMKDITQYFWLHKRFKSQPNLPRGFLYKNC